MASFTVSATESKPETLQNKEYDDVILVNENQEEDFFYTHFRIGRVNGVYTVIFCNEVGNGKVRPIPTPRSIQKQVDDMNNSENVGSTEQ